MNIAQKEPFRRLCSSGHLKVEYSFKTAHHFRRARNVLIR